MPGIAWSDGKIVDKQGQLYTIEERAVASAVQKRKAAFRAGRTCAREALCQLGFAETPIPMQEDRSPGWPDGVVGSITHSTCWAASIVAHKDSYAGLGIDIEEDGPLEPGLRQMLLCPDECAKLPTTITIDTHLIDTTKTVFVIKEAVFKAVYPLVGVRFDFQDASVSIDPSRRRFSTIINLPDLRSSYRVVEGSIGRGNNHIVATAVIPTSSDQN